MTALDNGILPVIDTIYFNCNNRVYEDLQLKKYV